MSRSQDLYQLQEYDSALDTARARIQKIDQILGDDSNLRSAQEILTRKEEVFDQKHKEFKRAETAVNDQNIKIEQNQKRLYGGAVTNPKELEDLQLESESLQRYLSVLEDKQLEAMLVMEEAESEKQSASAALESVREELTSLHASLLEERNNLELQIKSAEKAKEDFLTMNEIADLAEYTSSRKRSGGIAVTLMISDSCSACGASIPSAIAQEARSPGKLAFCPTCKRILHPG